jgi:chorismate synthase
MAGAVAKKLLRKWLGVEVLAYSLEIGGVRAGPLTVEQIRELRYSNEVRCPDIEAAERMRSVYIGEQEEGRQRWGGS